MVATVPGASGQRDGVLRCTLDPAVGDDAPDVVRLAQGLSLAVISDSDIVNVVTSDPSDHLPLAPAQFNVLVALSNGPLHGYAIMQAVEEASDRLVQMGPATVYSTLQRLTALGLTEECTGPPDSDDDQRRRYYQLTGLGQAVCAAEADRLAALARTAHTNLRPRLA
jgi:DNA-binding PadR family transcriptional regulator